MSFKDYKIKKEYRSLVDNVVQDFYIPLLGEAISYRRAVGFFSSTALVEISKGITGLVKNGGHIDLIASPYLSDEDIEAIEKGYEDRDTIIERALLTQLSDEHADHFSAERLNLLANLIADGVMDVHIAYTESDKRLGMYHEKMGIMVDKEGNKIAFSGSMNETKTALSFNYETIDVFCEWQSEDAAERVEAKGKAFDKIWSNREPNMEVKQFPQVSKAIIEKYRNKKPNLEIDEDQFPDKPIKAKEHKNNGPKVPESVTLYDYQKEAITSWVSENYRGIFDMATGTGKTYTGLGAISKLSNDLNDHLAVVIVCPYQHLVDQWVEDIVKFDIKPVIGYSSSPQKDWRNLLSKAVRDQKIRPDKSFFCFVCTNATFTNGFVQKEISKIKEPILLVVDEAHNFGAPTLLRLLDDRFTYRLALSATLDRHRDEEGTAALYSFFGKKCIEYTLERAIKEDKLTQYKYYPELVYLNDEELSEYEKLSYEMSKNLITGKNGKPKLNSYGELLAIQRSRIVAAAVLKIQKLKELIIPYVDDHFILVYCGATTILNPSKDVTDTNEGDVKQITVVTSILGNEFGMKVARFTANENVEERSTIKEHFQDGDDLQAIVAIKCLDEGVNIPGIRTAFILASSTNPKEYIQRRGRVLRKAPGKDFAEIYDFITLPRPLDEVPGLTQDQMNRDLSLVRNELSRVKEFGNLSMNSMKATELIWKICDIYHLPYDFIEHEEGDDQ